MTDCINCAHLSLKPIAPARYPTPQQVAAGQAPCREQLIQGHPMFVDFRRARKCELWEQAGDGVAELRAEYLRQLK